MPHTDDEIERAARRFDQLPAELDPATAEGDHTDDLRAHHAVPQARPPPGAGHAPGTGVTVRPGCPGGGTSPWSRSWWCRS